MCTFINELFLYEYFTFEAAVNRFCDRRELFDRLARLYSVADADGLYALVSGERVAEIATANDYKKYRRIKLYAESNGLSIDYSDAECDAIDIKGRALTDAQELKFIEPGAVTQASVYSNITQKAKLGVVLALRVLGVLQCEGIFFPKRVKSGIKNLSRAARWNDIPSEIALVTYDAQNRDEHIQRLATLSEGLPAADIAEAMCVKYGLGEQKTVSECILLSKAFGRGQLKPQIYVPEIANLLYSTVVGYKDKEKLLLSEIQGVALLADIPLKLASGSIPFDPSALDALPLARPEESKRILQSASNNDIRSLDSFKPLCITSGSRYMLEHYADALTALFAGANVARIDAGDISSHDLDQSINNIFLRNCNENVDNVFLLIFCGDIHEAVLHEACDFLLSARRRRLRLVQPNIEIDLSAVLPIVLCDKDNAEAFRSVCDVVKIAEPEKSEYGMALAAMLAEKQVIYGTGSITLTDDAVDKLCAMSLDDAEDALDKAIVACRRGGQPLALDKESVREFTKKGSGRSFGYGGSIK